jgi:hypothetical protein
VNDLEEKDVLHAYSLASSHARSYKAVNTTLGALSKKLIHREYLPSNTIISTATS